MCRIFETHTTMSPDHPLSRLDEEQDGNHYELNALFRDVVPLFGSEAVCQLHRECIRGGGLQIFESG